MTKSILPLVLCLSLVCGCRTAPAPLPPLPAAPATAPSAEPTPVVEALEAGGAPVPVESPAAIPARAPTPRGGEDLTAAAGPELDIEVLFYSERDGDAEIYVLDLEDRELIKLTDNGVFDGYPSWSHDRDRIVFVSERDGNREIYAMDDDGDDPARLTDNPGPDNFPSWAPDGDSIAFFSQTGSSDQLCLMESSGENPRWLTSFKEGKGGPTTFSPDGRKIAFAYLQTGLYKIYILDLAGGGPKEIIAHGSGESRFCWTPDGKAIVYISDKGEKKNIWKQHFEDGRFQCITRNGGDNFSPTLSPEGNRMIFCSTRDGGPWQLYLVDLDKEPAKNPVTRLTFDSSDYLYPDWK